MSLNRINTKSLVKQVEDELNRYSLTETTFKADQNNVVTAQEFVVPYGEAGYYKIELWGAQGGEIDGKVGGLGAYTSGTLYLQENEKLYFYVGKKGTSTNGGANGGAAGKEDAAQSLKVAGGGGATDVRLVEDSDLDLPSDTTSELTRIMVAAGGGGGGKSKIDGTEKSRKGGDGGTISGLRYSGQPQIAGAATQTVNNSTSFLYTSAHPGAGGGYTAGGIQEGGSSYIAGYAGVNSFTRNPDTPSITVPSYQNADTNFHFFAKEDIDSLEYQYIRDFHFFNAQMINGVQSGDGYATIRKVSSVDGDIPPVKTDYLNNITQIQDCVTTITSKNPNTPSDESKNTKSNIIQWPEIQLINKAGVNVLKGAPATITEGTLDETHGAANLATDGLMETYAATTDTTGRKCITIEVPADLRGENIELAVYHQPGVLEEHVLKVQYSSGSNYTIIEGGRAEDEIDGTHEIYITGDHISAYSPKYGSDDIPNGNYYIIPIAKRTLAVRTAAQSSTFGTGDTVDTTELTVAKMSGTNYQKWYFEKLGDGSDAYKIVDGQDSKALQIATGLYVNDHPVSAPYIYMGNPEEKWKFTASKLGRFQIYSSNGGVNAYLRHNSDYNTIIIDAIPITDPPTPVRNDKTKNLQAYKTQFYIINAEY